MLPPWYPIACSTVGEVRRRIAGDVVRAPASDPVLSVRRDANTARVGAHANPAREAFVVGAGLAYRAFHIDTSAGEEWTVVFACGKRVFDVLVGGDGTAELMTSTASNG